MLCSSADNELFVRHRHEVQPDIRVPHPVIWVDGSGTCSEPRLRRCTWAVLFFCNIARLVVKASYRSRCMMIGTLFLELISVQFRYSDALEWQCRHLGRLLVRFPWSEA